MLHDKWQWTHSAWTLCEQHDVRLYSENLVGWDQCRRVDRLC
jgi:hypothetical protein